MTPELRLRRLDALLSLLNRQHSAPASQRLGDALDALLDATPASAAAAFDRNTEGAPSAERRLGTAHAEPAASSARLLRALAALAERCLSSASAVRLSDVQRDRDGIDGAEEFVALGARAALAVPIVGERTLEGALVLLFANSAMLDAETLGYIDGVSRMTALSLERDRGNTSELSTREELGVSNRAAMLKLSTESLTQELSAPVGALSLQNEELRAIVAQLNLLAGKRDAALSDRVRELGELVTEMGGAIQRVGETLALHSARSRRDPKPTSLDLAEVAREALAVTGPQFERRGVLVVEQLDPACETSGRREHLVQVIINLLLNAMEAAQSAAPPRIWIRLLAEGNQLVLTVEDNGPGVASEHVGEIFKRTYSTKPRGQGRGLGLKICSEVVTAHGGHIEVAERVGGGACFRVHLPRVDGPALSARQTESSRATDGAASGKHRRVLLIDDDPIATRTLQRALRPHEVRSAGSASEAEIVLLDPSYEPDLVLCDMLLPGANGDTLHARVAERRPALAARFVFVTAGGLAKSEADYIRASGLLTLRKPLDVQTLSDLMNRRDEASHAMRTLTQSDAPSPQN